MDERQPAIYAPLEAPKGRLEWLDALRGFTMILVVAYHVSTNGFGEVEKSSMALPFLVSSSSVDSWLISQTSTGRGAVWE